MSFRALIPPPLYGLVEEGVHRSGVPAVPNFSFVERLKLKTILFLSPDPPTPELRSFMEDEGINTIGAENVGVSNWAPISEDTVLEALLLILDASKHPILIVDSNHLNHRTNVVVGSLRKAQGWALTSIFEECQRFGASKTRLQNEQFIELFDVDLVRFPAQGPPKWFRASLS